MSEQIGLATEVPTLELCRDMAAIPALAEAFKESTFVWVTNALKYGDWSGWTDIVARDFGLYQGMYRISAPTVREMLKAMDENPIMVLLEWMKDDDVPLERFYDPDALARACIEAARA